MTLVALAVAPALWFVAIRSRRTLFPANWDAQQEAGILVGQVEAAVTGVRVVKGFGQEQRELDEAQAESRTLFASRMRVVRLQAKFAPALQAIPALGQIGVLLLGGYLALHGDITLGTFLAFSTYLAQLVGPVRQVSALLTIGQQARAGVERVLDIVDASPEIFDAPDAVDIPDGPVTVELENVTFGYAKSRPVLRDVSLSIRPGETLALVGGAGSGKSTVSLLLPRFYDVHAGAVRVGGVDVRQARLASLRSRLGVVFEDSFLFSDSIKNNIAYGRHDATDEQIVAAARAAEADEFIRDLPEGYDTVVGERGLTLSGGQRQRIALGPRAAARPVGAGARRRDVRGRPSRRGRDQRHPAPGHGQPHDAARRPPPLVARAGRPDRRARSRARGRRRHRGRARAALPVVPAAALRPRRGRRRGRSRHARPRLGARSTTASTG